MRYIFVQLLLIDGNIVWWFLKTFERDPSLYDWIPLKTILPSLYVKRFIG